MAEITDPAVRERNTKMMRKLMLEVRNQQANDPQFRGSALEKRYMQSIDNLAKSLKRDDRISTPMSLGLGFSQAATGSLGEEISAAARAMMPESVMYPLYQVIGEKLDDIREDPLRELSPIYQAYDAMFGEDDEPSMRERYQQIRAEQYPEGTTPLEERPFMERYQTFLDSNRAQLARSREEDPGAYFGGELGGGLIQGGAGLTKSVAGKGLSLAQSIPRLMTSGGGIGALYGYGSSEGDPIATALQGGDVGPEMAQAGRDTAIGTGFGALSAGGIPMMGTFGRRIAQQFVPEERRIAEKARQQVAEAFEFDVERGVTTREQAEKMLDVPEMTIADVGRATKEAAKEVAATPTAGAETLRKFYENRNLGTAGRLRETMTDALMIESDDLAAANLAFMREKGRNADEAYKLAYSTGIEMTGNMRQLLQTPFGQQAMRKAKIMRANRGKNPDALNLTGAMQSTRDMDSVLRSMNARVKKAFRDGDADAADLAKMRDRFENMLYSNNPNYAAARRQYGTDSSRARALEYGQKLFEGRKQLPEYIRQDIARMGDAEKELLRLGTLESMVRQVTGGKKTADTVKGFWNNEGTNEILSMVIPDKKLYDQLIDSIDANREMFKTWSKVQKAAEKDPLAMNRARGWFSKVLELIGYTGGLQTPGAVGMARGTGYAGQQLGEAITGQTVSESEKMMADHMARQLMGTDLDALMTPQQMGGLLSTEVPRLGGTVPAGAVPTLGPVQGDAGEYGFPEERGDGLFGLLR